MRATVRNLNRIVGMLIDAIYRLACPSADSWCVIRKVGGNRSEKNGGYTGIRTWDPIIMSDVL